MIRDQRGQETEIVSVVGSRRLYGKGAIPESQSIMRIASVVSLLPPIHDARPATSMPASRHRRGPHSREIPWQIQSEPRILLDKHAGPSSERHLETGSEIGRASSLLSNRAINLTVLTLLTILRARLPSFERALPWTIQRRC